MKAEEYKMTREFFIHHTKYTVGDGLLVFRTKRNVHVSYGFYTKAFGKPFLKGMCHNLEQLATKKEWMDADRRKWFAVIR